MITPTTRAQLRLSLVKGVGAVRLRKALDEARRQARSVEDLVTAGGLRAILNDEQRNGVAEASGKLDALIDELSARRVAVWSLADDEYPEVLRRRLANAAPPLLMLRGNPDLLHLPAVGFCGSRAASEKGLQVAADCADQLARAGFVITSGYAAGVDMATHIAALRAGGATTLVLAEGIAAFRTRKDLVEVGDEERLCVVSEFPAHAAWSAGNAMQRNHTIVGLSRAMILIEARATGGSIAAGRVALDVGVPLFTPEYAGMPEEATGNRELLRVGARSLLRNGRTGRANLDVVIEAAHDAPPVAHATAAQMSLLG
jgi:DNA processing protein